MQSSSGLHGALLHHKCCPWNTEEDFPLHTKAEATEDTTELNSFGNIHIPQIFIEHLLRALLALGAKQWMSDKLPVLVELWFAFLTCLFFLIKPKFSLQKEKVDIII